MEDTKLIKSKESDGGRIEEIEKGKEERGTEVEKTTETSFQKEAEFGKSAKGNVRESKDLRDIEQLQMDNVMAIKVEDPKEIRKEPEDDRSEKMA